MGHLTNFQELTIMLKDGTEVFKSKYCRVIPSFGSLLIFLELMTTYNQGVNYPEPCWSPSTSRGEDSLMQISVS